MRWVLLRLIGATIRIRCFCLAFSVGDDAPVACDRQFEVFHCRRGEDTEVVVINAEGRWLVVSKLFLVSIPDLNSGSLRAVPSLPR